MRRTRNGQREPKVAVNAITPFLWFDDDAEEAANFYVSLFANSRITEVGRMADPKDLTKQVVLTVAFELAGRRFLALNGGPEFDHTPAFSMYVSCSTQRQVDTLWKRLTRGGRESRCGWLEDRFGLSWQIIPDRLPQALSDPDPELAARAMAAMMKMRKIDLRALELAIRGR